MNRKKKRGRKEGAFIALRRVRRPITYLLAVCGLLAFSPQWAIAGNMADLPLVENNGHFSCPTCYKGTPTQYGIAVGGADQTVGFVGPDADTHKMLFSGGASANPSLRLPTIADTPDSLKSGGANADGFVTRATAGGKVAGKQATFDSNGNLESSAYDVGAAGSIVPSFDVSPSTSTEVVDSTHPVYCGLDGSCSTTANGTDVQTRYAGSGTLTKLDCFATGATSATVSAEIFAGTCNAALATGTLKSVINTTAYGAATNSGTTSYTAGQCVVQKFSIASGAANKVVLRCSVQQTAGA